MFALTDVDDRFIDLVPLGPYADTIDLVGSLVTVVVPGRDVANSYDGELYRCLAGTKLQWTVSEAEGAAGETTACNKGDALWHGAGGRLECRPEKQARQCNERSLLRRYGAGVKVLTMIREETYTEYREEMVEGAASTGMIMMDGGVGGRVF